jgi:hypothetical protein
MLASSLGALSIKCFTVDGAHHAALKLSRRIGSTDVFSSLVFVCFYSRTKRDGIIFVKLHGIQGIA